MRPTFSRIPLLVFISMGCSSVLASPKTPNGAVKKPNQTKSGLRSFKGWELYSWKPQGLPWHFNLLEGTNRNKFLQEAQSTKTAIIGIPALKKRLSQLAAGEMVSWAGQKSIQPQGQLSFPPRQERETIKKFAKQHKLDLYAPN